MMRMGLGVLKLSPSAFWDMTPLELTRAMEGHRMTVDPKYDPDAAANQVTDEQRRFMNQLDKRLIAKRGGSSSIRPLHLQGRAGMEAAGVRLKK